MGIVLKKYKVEIWETYFSVAYYRCVWRDERIGFLWLFRKTGV